MTLAVAAVVGGTSTVVPLVAELALVGYSARASVSNGIWSSAKATTTNGATVVVKGGGTTSGT